MDLRWCVIFLVSSYATCQENVSFATAPCSSCFVREEIKNMSIEAIKEHVLNKLGLHKAPNMTGRILPKFPPLEHLIQAYGRKNKEIRLNPEMLGDAPFNEVPIWLNEGDERDDDDYFAKTERVFAFTKPHPKLRHWREQNVLYYSFSEKVLHTRLISAKLWIHVRGSEKQEKLNITVNKLVRLNNKSDIPTIQPLNPVLNVTPPKNCAKGEWVSMDVKQLVAEWFKFPKENLGITINVQSENDAQNTKLVVTNPEDKENSNNIPFIEMVTKETLKSRLKRELGNDCSESAPSEYCCRYPLTVDFNQTVGWEFIVEPVKYEAYYCAGKCPTTYKQSYMHTMMAEKSGKEACCAPREFTGLYTLHYDNSGNIVFTYIPNMIVVRCGCS